MVEVDKRLLQLENRLKHARRRALFVWAAGLIVMVPAVLNISLPPASAQGGQAGLEQRVTALEVQVSSLKTQVTSQSDEIAALQSLLEHFSRDGNDIFITGANLHITNGLG